ncbi:MAG: CpaF family protein [Gammaproteobacteria bacterium]|nr:CpaF family protein [Gammaproteobacteria bacterium]
MKSSAIEQTPNLDIVVRLDQEREWQKRIHDKLMKVVDLSLIGSMDERTARTQIREITQRIMLNDNVPLSAQARQRISKEIEDEILGLGPLEPLLADDGVSDILVNGYNSVYVERRGQLEKVNVQFRDDKHLLNIIDRIVSGVGRRIDESSPMVDARLKDGSRVNAIIPPLAIDGPSLSIRRFTVERLGIEQLIETGSITEQMAELLRGVVKSRLNVLISGGTGTGKTTMLNVLSGFISPRERIVTIEDSAELQLQQPHVVRLETRPPNTEGRGEVNQRDLVKNCLRMRPDRIILGEVRGAEALDMLQAMNTGHDGSLATLHANTPRDAIGRLENMVSMAGLKLPMSAVRTQIASAVDVILQLERMEDGTRRVTSIQEIQGMEGDIITLSEIFCFRRKGLDENGMVTGHFCATGLVPKFNEDLRKRGYELDMRIFSPESGRR